jgi:hypothetical protein
MQYAQQGMPPAAAKPPVTGWDVALSVCLLAAGFAGCVVVALGGFFVFAFADYCPPESCHPGPAVAWLGAGLSVAGAAVLLGAIGVAAFVIRRRPAWPIAATATLVCVAGCGAGLAGEFSSLW